MIGRIWHGWTTPDNADTYEHIVSTEVLPEIAAKRIVGYHGAHLLRRPHADEVEFVTILWFDSLDAIQGLTGDDHEQAHVPPRARAVLTRFDQRAQHYETLLVPDA